MKKVLIGLSIACALSTNLFAINISDSSTNSQNTNTEKSISTKDGSESRNNQSKRKSYSEAKEESEGNTRTLTKASQTDIFDKIAELEKVKGSFFKSCKVITNPKLKEDFGIGSDIQDNDYGYYDSKKASIMDNAVKSNANIESLSSVSETKIREYANCMLKYSMIGAQSLIDGHFTTDITDRTLLSVNSKAEETLKDRRIKCRFAKDAESIKCGSLKIVLDYNPILMDNQITLFSSEKFVNLSGTTAYDYKTNTSKRDEDSKSLEQSSSTTKATDAVINKKAGTGTTAESKVDLSADSFFKHLF